MPLYPQDGNLVPLKNLSRVFLVLAVAGLLIRVANFANPINDWDEMIYALVAHSLIYGDLPYQGVFDHKPIALYYLFAGFFWIFGYTLAAIRVMPLVAIALTTWLLYRIAIRQLPSNLHFAALCAILFMATCNSFGNWGLSSNTEILQMPLFAAWWLVALNCPESRWWRPLLMGALAGLAAQSNYLGGFILALSTALMLAWTLHGKVSGATLRRFVVQGALALSAFIATALLMLAPLIVAGDLSQYLVLQRAFLGGYQGILTHEMLLRAILALAISSGFVVALLACMARFEASLRSLPPASLRLLAQLAIVYVVILVAIAMTKRLFPHYFNWLIVPSTLILLALLGSSGARTLRAFTYLTAVIGTILVARGAWDADLKYRVRDFGQKHEIAQLTQEIRSHAKSGERVLLLGMNTVLYFLADVRPASRFINDSHVLMDEFMSKIGSSPEQEFIKALETKPVYVLVCYDARAEDYLQLMEHGLKGNKASYRMYPHPHLAAYLQFVERELAADYIGYSLSGYNECRDLKGYTQFTKANS